jgi:hypothetical protein
MIRAIIYGNRLFTELHILMKSMRRGRLPFIINIESSPYQFQWRHVVEHQLMMARRYPDDILVCVDAYDYLFLGEVEELEALLSKHSLLLPSSPSCWPHPAKAEAYELKQKEIKGIKGHWRWVNGSGPAGRGREIEAAILYGLEHFPISERHIKTDSVLGYDCNQRFWTDLYLAGWGEVDWKCELSQVIFKSQPGELGYKDGRLHNLVTGSKPQFIHAASQTWESIPKELLP